MDSIKLPSLIKDNEILFWKTICKMGHHKRHHIILRPYFPKQDAPGRFLKPEESQQMMGFIPGRPAQFKSTVDIAVSQMIHQTAPDPSLQPFHNSLIDSLPFIRFPRRQRITDLFIAFLPKPCEYCPSYLVCLLYVRHNFPVFGK